MDENDISPRIRDAALTVLSRQHYILRKAQFDYRRREGAWQTQIRESYDIGHGAAVLPIDAVRGRILLVRQFRWPAFESGYRRLLVEAVAGKLDGDDPQTCVIREAMEEAGATIRNVRRVFHCFMSPGAVTERLSLFVADYDSSALRAKGGGHQEEGEDIDVLEPTLDEAMTMVAQGEIADAKTIMLLQWAALNALR